MAKKSAVKVAPNAPPLERLFARASGARLCYGKPIEAAGRVIVPVASVRSAGGWGLGAGEGMDPTGGAGALQASPLGFIDIGPDGAKFQRINDRSHNALRALAGSAVALLALRRAVRQRPGTTPLRLPRPDPRRLLSSR